MPTGAMSRTLHEHPFAAYCSKALIALYERDVPFDRHLVGDAADREALQALWPMGSIPVLVDDGLVIPESLGDRRAPRRGPVTRRRSSPPGAARRCRRGCGTGSSTGTS